MNDETRRNLAFAIEIPITLGLAALDGAWQPFWGLSWLVNTAVIVGSMVPVVLWKRTLLARLLFWAITAMCLAVLPLQLLENLVSRDWLNAVIPLAIAIEGCWWVLLIMPSHRPQAAPPEQVVHHVHHGLPGTAPAPVYIGSEAFPVVAGTVERPSLGRRALKALTVGTSGAPQPAAREPEGWRAR